MAKPSKLFANYNVTVSYCDDTMFIFMLEDISRYFSEIGIDMTVEMLLVPHIRLVRSLVEDGKSITTRKVRVRVSQFDGTLVAYPA